MHLIDKLINYIQAHKFEITQINGLEVHFDSFFLKEIIDILSDYSKDFPITFTLSGNRILLNILPLFEFYERDDYYRLFN